MKDQFDKTTLNAISYEIIEEITTEYLDGMLPLRDILKCATKAQLSLAILEKLYQENASEYDEVISKEEVKTFSKELLNTSGVMLADKLKNISDSERLNTQIQEKLPLKDK